MRGGRGKGLVGFVNINGVLMEWVDWMECLND